MHLSGPDIAYHNNGQPVLSYDPTALVKLLNWVGGANLVELMLPTVVAFHYDAAMAYLVLPSLKVLKLVRKRAPSMNHSDLLRQVGLYPDLVTSKQAHRLASTGHVRNLLRIPIR